MKRVGGGYLHTPKPAPKAAAPNAALDSGPDGLPQAPEQDSDQPSLPPKSPLPPVLPTLSKPAAGVGLDEELASALAQMRMRADETDAEGAGTSHEDISTSSPSGHAARAEPQAAVIILHSQSIIVSCLFASCFKVIHGQTH